jgi:hypothetical protein
MMPQAGYRLRIGIGVSMLDVAANVCSNKYINIIALLEDYNNAVLYTLLLQQATSL